MTENCIFCQIVARQIPARVVYQDETVTAFQDHMPAAPVHVLIVPNRHIKSLNHASEADEALLGHLVIVAHKLAEDYLIDKTGYRLVMNTGLDAGQSVFHLHYHLMGGRRLQGLRR